MQELIEVTSEYLVQTEEEMQTELRKAQKKYLQITQDMEQLSDIVQAAGMRQLCRSIRREKETAQKTFQKMEVHIHKLRIMAETYETTERRNQDADAGH